MLTTNLANDNAHISHLHHHLRHQTLPTTSNVATMTDSTWNNPFFHSLTTKSFRKTPTCINV
jgi:hypothetical protein